MGPESPAFVLKGLADEQFTSFLLDVAQLLPLPLSMPDLMDVDDRPLRDFLHGMLTFLQLPREISLSSVVILRRYLSERREPLLLRHTARGAVMMSLLAAAKEGMEEPRPLEDWDAATGRLYGLDFLASLEREFLSLIDYDILVRRRDLLELWTLAEVQLLLESYRQPNAVRWGPVREKTLRQIMV